MAELKQALLELSGTMSISGHESCAAEKLRELYSPYFDEHYSSPNGNQVFIKRSKKEDAPRLLIDAHLDEIGMLVTEIKKEGFIRVTNLGGIDTRILLAGEVILYGSEPVYGIVCVTPPHLQKPGENSTLPPVSELLIDTGFTAGELETKGIAIGTPVGFKPVNTELLGGLIAGKGFDDKACIAAAAEAVRLLDGEDTGWDIFLLCACKEETGSLGGKTGAYEINPDAAIVLDVNLAFVPDTKRHETVKLGDGPSVSISAVTDRSLTRAIINFAKEKELRCQTVVEATDTGTDANCIPFVREGIPAAVISIPLKNMHTYSEVISLADVGDTAKLLAEFIRGGLTKWMNA